MTKIAREVIDSERDGNHATVEPKDAATLIIVDRSAAVPKVLLGRRHARHVFLPGKFVFPGGRVDTIDRLMPAAKPLHPDTERKLRYGTKLNSANEIRALPLAAIRETFEETGIVIGAQAQGAGEIPAGAWAKFVEAGYYPDPSALHFIARAITPPGFARRFDARFFCVEGAAIGRRLENVVHAEAELVELTWLPIAAAQDLDLPVITRQVLIDLQQRLRAGLPRELPVPFYQPQDYELIGEMIA